MAKHHALTQRKGLISRVGITLLVGLLFVTGFSDNPISAAQSVPTSTDVGYDIVLVLGQSNAVGADTAIDATHYDYTDPRIMAFDSTGPFAGKVRLGSDPLYHLIGPSNGVGPGMAFARRYVKDIPNNRSLLLVPAAFSGTPIYGKDGNTGASRNWDPAGSGAINLYETALYRANLALAAGGPNSRIVAVTWSQGESDVANGTSPAQYQIGLEQIIDGLRDRLGVRNLPFLISGMLPETVATNSGTAAIDAVQRGIPARKANTAFVAGPSGMGIGDIFHYNSAGARIIGTTLADTGLPFALANSGSVAYNPPARPAVAAVYSSDSFQRANRSGLGRSDGPGSYGWVSEGFDASIVNNVTGLTAVTGSTHRITTIDDGHAGGVVRATFDKVATAGIAFADTGAAGGGYVACWSAQYSAWVVFRRDGDVYTNPTGGLANTNFAPVIGSVLSATVPGDGSPIVVEVDGNVIYTFTNPVYNGTRWGMFNVDSADQAATFSGWSHKSF